MKNVLCLQMVLILLAVVMPAVCMKNDGMVQFQGDFNILLIAKSNLRFMNAWDAHYKKHKKIADKGGILPLFPNVSAEVLELVNKALDIGPYTFKQHYDQLSPEKKCLLIKGAGQYGDDGKRSMLHIPELTKRLVEACLPLDVCQHIRKYFVDDDREYVRSYCKDRLISNKRLLGALALKIPMWFRNNNDVIGKIIHPSSLFLDRYHTNHCDSSIPLILANKKYQTYATHFVTDTYECRITDIKNNRCNLWVINHNNIDDPNYTFSTAITHQGNIKGCCFSNMGTGVEYAVTYSDYDMQVATITTQNGVSFVEMSTISANQGSSIVDVCFGHDQTELLIATCGDMDSYIQSYCIISKDCRPGVPIPFKENGLLERIMIGRNDRANFLLCLYAVAGFYKVHLYELLDQGGYEFKNSTKLMNMQHFNDDHCSMGRLISRGNSVFMYESSNSLFKKTWQTAQEKSPQGWSIQDIVNGSLERLDSDCHRIYSPDGKFLLYNSLVKKAGGFYVETVLKDAVTHHEIITVDTPYCSFLGVGFTHDGTELVFLHDEGLPYTISLLNDTDNKAMEEMENIAFNNMGIASLLKRLCIECKDKGAIPLHTSDPTYTMLKEWSKRSTMIFDFLQQCFPFYKVKK